MVITALQNFRFSHLISLRYILLLSSHPHLGLSWSLPFSLSHQNLVCLSLFLHTSYMNYPSHHSWLDQLNNPVFITYLCYIPVCIHNYLALLCYITLFIFYVLVLNPRLWHRNPESYLILTLWSTISKT
jgi:hypothetical protein